MNEHYEVTCTQAADDGCSTDPELGTCPACGYVMHDLPLSTDDAHGELCCGTPICSATFGDICTTHGTFPPQPPLPEQAREEELIPSVVDGLIRPEDMCAGSEGRQVMFNGNTVQCSSCERWLPAYPGSFLAPVHAVQAAAPDCACCGMSHVQRWQAGAWACSWCDGEQACCRS